MTPVVSGTDRVDRSGPDRWPRTPRESWRSPRTGDGVLANLAIDRALRVDPAYPAALLLVDFICHWFRPDELDDQDTYPAGADHRAPSKRRPAFLIASVGRSWVGVAGGVDIQSSASICSGSDANVTGQ